MENLINITEQNHMQVVSARELYAFLESKANFADWCKRMFEYGFEEDKDFITILGKSTGGRPSVDYALTLDCAKEISMIQRNDKGKQARQYFIEVEKRTKNIIKLPTNKELTQMLIDAENEKERLLSITELQNQEIKQAAPKVEYFDKVLQSNSTYTTNQIAKELGMSAIELNKKLHDLGIQYKQSETWLLYAKYQNQGYTKTKTHTFTDSYGNQQTAMQTVWTERGRKFIHACVDVTGRKQNLQKKLEAFDNA
jgi:anti-repressor protein